MVMVLKKGMIFFVKQLLKTTSYQVSYIYKELLHTMQNSDIRKMLHHVFALSDENVSTKIEANDKIAVIVFSYYADLVEEDIAYMQSMPAESDAYIVVVSDTLRGIWEQKKAALPCKERLSILSKILAEFRRLRRNSMKSVFRSDMCAPENTSRPASVRAQRVRSSGAQILLKKAICLF